MAESGAAGSARPDPRAVGQAAVVGTGVIGAGWTAHFLGRGLDVVAFDPGRDAEALLRRRVERAWPALERLGLRPGASPDRLRFAATLEEAVSDAPFIQESAPEQEALKRDLLARIDAVAPDHAVIASSSSGLLPSRIQDTCRRPERVVIGHPFNPVYILPLVEILGGQATASSVIDWAMAFYRAVGKRPLRLHHEIEGYVSDRLQEAMWREALHMVAEGVATTEEIDAAITDGPGLRWAIMGPCLTFHLAGGDQGMAHMLAQFGPALKLPWTKLVAPELTEDLTRAMVEGTAAQASGRPVADLEAERDICLIEILRVLERHRKSS